MIGPEQTAMCLRAFVRSKCWQKGIRDFWLKNVIECSLWLYTRTRWCDRGIANDTGFECDVPTPPYCLEERMRDTELGEAVQYKVRQKHYDSVWGQTAGNDPSVLFIFWQSCYLSTWIKCALIIVNKCEGDLGWREKERCKFMLIILILIKSRGYAFLWHQWEM